MTPKFERAFPILLRHEGGYVNDPRDPGGETNLGITKVVARANGYRGPMKEMPVEVAKAIYASRYWLPVFDQLPFGIALQVFDGAVNSSVVRSVKWLQKASGAKVDGILGAKTLVAVLSADAKSVVFAYNRERLNFLMSLPTWPVFGKTWTRRIMTNLEIGVL